MESTENNKECKVVNFTEAVEKMDRERRQVILDALLERFYKLSYHLDDDYRPENPNMNAS